MHKNYVSNLIEHKQFHAGYPYNLEFSFSKYGYLLDYLVNNLGDPFIPSNYSMDSREFEKEIIKYFANLWGLKETWGYVTSSGTEGNLAALLYGKIALTDPVVYYSEDTHYSIGKGCMAYSLDSVVLKSTATGEISYEDLQKQISPYLNRPALVICNLSTTFRGAYDSAEKLLNVFLDRGFDRSQIFLHGDGALGGMILPFLKGVPEEYAVNGQRFDSISVSGHKMPGVPVPCGVILTRKSVVEKMARDIEYLNSKDTTLNGSRNGLAAILLYHALTDRSHQAWESTISRCIHLAQYFSSALRQSGIESQINTHSNTVVFPKPSDAIIQKWQLACLGNQAHVVIMPNHNESILETLANTLTECFSGVDNLKVGV